MPLSMQRDVKEFFGNFKNACDTADALLFEAGKSELIDAACLRAKVGRLTSNALYLHHSAILSLEHKRTRNPGWFLDGVAWRASPGHAG